MLLTMTEARVQDSNQKHPTTSLVMCKPPRRDYKKRRASCWYIYMQLCRKSVLSVIKLSGETSLPLRRPFPPLKSNFVDRIGNVLKWSMYPFSYVPKCTMCRCGSRVQKWNVYHKKCTEYGHLPKQTYRYGRNPQLKRKRFIFSALRSFKPVQRFKNRRE